MLKFILSTAALALSDTLLSKCDSTLPNLSVGDEWLDDKNYTKFKKKHKVFILATSDSQCEVCCYSETVLRDLQAKF